MTHSCQTTIQKRPIPIYELSDSKIPTPIKTPEETMTTYRAAVIGLGRMGSTFDDEMSEGGSIFLPYCHAPSYCASPHTELVAGADLHDEQRAIFGDRWGLEQDHLYSDYRQMLERENLDVVSVLHHRPHSLADRRGLRQRWRQGRMGPKSPLR